MTGDKPYFYDEWVDSTGDKWTLKEGAPEQVVNDFNEYVNIGLERSVEDINAAAVKLLKENIDLLD